MRKYLRRYLSSYGDVDSAMQWAFGATLAWGWVAFSGWTLRDWVIIQWGMVVLACLVTAIRTMREAR